MLKFLTLFLLACVLSISANAATGCVNASRTTIYTSFQNGQQYWRTSPSTSSSPGCFFVYTGGVCSIGSFGANNGYLGDTNVEECPIDDYVWIMIALLGGLGYLVIRQRNIRIATA